MKKANRFAVLALCILLLAGGLPAAVLAEADPTPDAVLAETPAPAEPSSETPPEDKAALVTLPEYMSDEGDVSWRITDDDPNSRIRVKARYDITLFVPEGAAPTFVRLDGSICSNRSFFALSSPTSVYTSRYALSVVCLW